MIYAEIFMKLLPRMPLEKKRILNESRKWNNSNRIMGEEKQEKAKAKRINRLIRVKCQINDREMLYAADVNVCVSCGFAKTCSDILKSTRNP